jgi:hypothetical protein
VGGEGGVDIIRSDKDDHNVGPLGQHGVESLQDIVGQIAIYPGIDKVEAIFTQSLSQNIYKADADLSPDVAVT